MQSGLNSQACLQKITIWRTFGQTFSTMISLIIICFLSIQLLLQNLVVSKTFSNEFSRTFFLSRYIRYHGSRLASIFTISCFLFSHGIIYQIYICLHLWFLILNSKIYRLLLYYEMRMLKLCSVG